MPLTLISSRSDSERARRAALRVSFPAALYATNPAKAAAAWAAPNPTAKLNLSGAKDSGEQAISLLNTAAEIEHGLMIEYLYAAGSLQDADAASLIAAIASEEMGHLVTVQNLLLALGGDPCLQRQDQHGDPKLDPFRFELRPARLPVVAAFVAAESPQPGSLRWCRRRELARIVAKAETHLSGVAIHRVAVVYGQLRALLLNDPLFEQVGADPAAAAHQASPDEAWAHGGLDRAMIVRSIDSNAEAVAAVDAIASQGEGFTTCAHSHFERFRRLYRGIRRSRWVPNVLLRFDGMLTHRLPRLWRALGFYAPGVSLRPLGIAGRPGTELLNARYRILLLSIHAVLDRRRTDPDRAQLISLLLREMALVFPALLRWLRLHEEGGTEPGVFTLPPNFPPYAYDERDERLKDDLATSAARAAELAGTASGALLANVLTEISALDAARAALRDDDQEPNHG